MKFTLLGINLREFAHIRLQKKDTGATIKNVDIDKEIIQILQEAQINLDAIEEEKDVEVEDEEEDEGVTMKLPVKKVAPPEEEEKKGDDEDEDEGVTLKPGQKPTTKAPEVQVENYDDEENETTQRIGQTQAKTFENVDPNTAKFYLTEKDKQKMAQVTTRKEVKHVKLPVRIASKQSEIIASKDEDKEHPLFLYKNKKIIHSQIFKEYSLEPEYKNNLDLLIKRACEKQTVVIIDDDKFEAQDTEEKVKKFMRANSRYFKDVIDIKELARGGESIIYTLEHSLPDELIIKCPVLDEVTQVNNLPSAFNGILYESQIINLNRHAGHVVNNIEEIILYNEKKNVITNYCVIVEKAKYSFEQLISRWKDNEKQHSEQDFYSPEKVGFYFLQTLMALHYFHERNIYYGDMKAANLLIFRNQEVKIGDLGVSIKLQPKDAKKRVRGTTFFDELAIEDDPELKALEDELLALNVEFGDELRVAKTEGRYAGEDDVMENPVYPLKGLTGGYVTQKITDSYYKATPVKKEDLFANDHHAVIVTFDKIIKELRSCKGYTYNKDNYYLQIVADLKRKLSIEDTMWKYAFAVDGDYSFKNKLCDQLKKEYKFLGLPKIHLFLYQNLITNFYMKKQIVYQKDIEEDDATATEEEKFMVEKPDAYRGQFITRDEERFPYLQVESDKNEKRMIPQEQIERERVDFYWAFRAAKLTVDSIQKDLDKVMKEDLLIRVKEKDEKMYDYKEFKIKEVIKNRDVCLNAIKLIDAICGPNHEGLQIELQYKLGHEIAKGLVKEYSELAKTQQGEAQEKTIEKETESRELGTRFLRRLEQYFVLEYQENKDTGFKEQQIRQLEDQLNKNYENCFVSDAKGEKFEKINTIQFAFYSYFKFKYNRKHMNKRKPLKSDLIKQIKYIEDSLPIFKNLMGENVNLQNNLYYKQAQSMMDGEFYAEVREDDNKNDILVGGYLNKGANDNYKRLYLTKKSLQSFHDFVYSYRLKLEQALIRGYPIKEKKYEARGGTREELINYKECVDLMIEEIEIIYNDDRMQSGFLLFKEFLNRYYKYVPGYGLKNAKITERFKYLDEDNIEDIIPQRVPQFFFYQFSRFLKQINDNSTEDISKKRVHQYSYDEMRPKNTYLNLNCKCLDLNKIDLSESILSDDIELLLQFQHHKVTLKKIIVNFDVNQKIIAIDCVYWNSNLEKEIKTDHYKEFKQSEIVFEFPEHVYPISMQLIVGRRLTMRLSNFEYYQIDSDFPDTWHVEKENRMTLFTKLFRPFCEVILGNFQFYNPVKQSLESQAYYLKMSRQHHMFNMVRSLIHKNIQIVHDYDQIDENEKHKNSLIVYRDKYLLTLDIYQKLKTELREGKVEFDWLFGQEKLLNQRRTNWKQYLKDVRNHLIYYWKNLQINEAFMKNNTAEDIKKGVKAATQEAQILHTIESLETATKTMLEHLNNRYIYINDELDWTIKVGYKLGGNSNTLTDLSQMSTLEKQVYIYQLIVMLMIVYSQGFTVGTINKIEYGQDIFLIDVTYVDINCLAEIFTTEELIPILKTHFKDTLKDLEAEIIPKIKKFEELEDLLADWRDQFARNFRSSLAEIVKKDKLLAHFMRILPIPPSKFFQSELYLFEKEKRVKKYTFTPDDQILIELMLLRASHKTKRPQNTIRKTKYAQKDQFNPENITRIFNELKADTNSEKLFEFYKEQIFRFHVFDTAPYFMDQWRNEISKLYEQKELIQYANYFFYSSYDYYSISLGELKQQMSDLFEAVGKETARETIKVIFQIVLARIQGSLNANKAPYINFLKTQYDLTVDAQKTAYEDIVKKVDDYIKSEYDDPDYKGYEAEFSEFNDCQDAIKLLKDQRPWKDSHVKYPKELNPQLLEHFNNTVREQFNFLTKESEKAKNLADQIVSIEQAQPDANKLQNLNPAGWAENKQQLADIHDQTVGNLLMKKLLLKSSRTKHRVFNQFRIAKKYLRPYEAYIRTLNNEALLKKYYKLQNKSYEVTLVEQIDHQYLPKYREIFNRLDDDHRITNFDDFEAVAAQAHRYAHWLQNHEESQTLTVQRGMSTKLDLLKQKTGSAKRSQTRSQKQQQPKDEEEEKERRDVLANKYLDLNYWPVVASIDIYFDNELTVHDVVATYRFPNNKDYHETFQGHTTTAAGKSHLRKVTLQLKAEDNDKEILSEVSATGSKLTDLFFLVQADFNHNLHFNENLEIVRDDVDLDTNFRNFLSFSGLTSEAGLINLNQYYHFYTVDQDPEEEHVYYECDSDDDDYFNPGEPDI